MSRSLTPQDGYALMNELVREATGQKSISVVDLSSFISAGETVLSTSRENIYNALGMVMGRLSVAARPYKAKFNLINSISTDCYTSRLRKISFYAKDALASGFFNTNLWTNIKDGFTAGQNPDGNGDPQSTKSQWEQHLAMPLQVDFGGSTAWDTAITIEEEQIRAAFKDPTELAKFIQGKMIEHENDIESEKEAFSRMTVLGEIGALYQYDVVLASTKGCAINLVSGFNSKFGTNYTGDQLRSTYLPEFLKYFTTTVKGCMDYLTERSADHHLPMTKTVNGTTYSILRHTPKEKQRLMLFNPLFRDAEAMVMPEIFRPEYLDMEKQYEGVNYWQSNSGSDKDRAAVKVKSAYYDSSDGTQKSTGAIEIPYVVGLLYDEDAMMVDFQLERALSTGIEARKGYSNVWLHFSKNAIVDPTENAILFYMGS